MPKRRNLKQPGKCIFCGRTGLSKEHVLSKWLRRLMISHAVGGHLVVPIGVGHGTSLPLVQKPQLKQGSIFSKQVRVVCRIHCNNGWMDKLERTAKLPLLPLVSGHNHNIDRISQTILARWFAKTTMTAEYIYRGEILIPR